ncbi:hypothetical protein HDF26_005224 [Pedobacter cryoconitis]|uniref:Uncharacterized protein n=1 Tax=Pedobacter cryoconitis TaxID=188932 RepID=A0A7W8ZMS8_9SPHI|nr:hypothetical protein [Pedobacter cryoconitis]MBB5636748.1 hypothetical protein [Pedobacter cryoconitis]MBB6274742.1 hypothetical protein [Pedobacter cryoconitis]
MENNEKLICGLSDAQILQLKEKHGFLILGEVKQAGTTYQAIFREPDFKTLEATGAVGEKNAIKGTIALFDNCVIASDDALSQRDFLKLKAVECLAQHMNSFNVTVKNL